MNKLSAASNILLLNEKEVEPKRELAKITELKQD